MGQIFVFSSDPFYRARAEIQKYFRLVFGSNKDSEIIWPLESNIDRKVRIFVIPQVGSQYILENFSLDRISIKAMKC